MSDADTQRSVGQLLQRVKTLEQLSDDRERIAIIDRVNSEAGAVLSRLHELEQRFTELWRDMQSKSAPAEILSKLDDALVATSELGQKQHATALRLLERVGLLEERCDGHARQIVELAERGAFWSARVEALEVSIPSRVTAFTSAVEGLRGTLYEQGAQLSKVASLLEPEPEPPELDESSDPAVAASAALRRALINYWLNDTIKESELLQATADLARALDPETFELAAKARADSNADFLKQQPGEGEG